jgi:CheY-like chemotaxis protein
MSSTDQPLKNLHLLVIEDEQDTRELLTFVLESEGAAVTTVIHIYEALDVLKQFRPDVILSNIHLPDGDGYTLLSLWRKEEAELGIEPVPAIIVTESEREIHKKRIHQAGFQTYISKPFEIDKIAEIVANVACSVK